MGGFWISKTEVTNTQYRACVEKDACNPPSSKTSFSRSSYYDNPEYDNYPGVFVSWSDAIAYARWLAQETGETIQLPSEAEWEKACRGTEGHIYPWDQGGPNKELLNYGSLVGDTTEVGSYPAGVSTYGALDMAGNVWEWTRSVYENYPYNPTDGREDLEAEGNRVLRGGSWLLHPDVARCAYRFNNPPDYFGDNLGFRLVAATSLAP